MSKIAYTIIKKADGDYHLRSDKIPLGDFNSKELAIQAMKIAIENETYNYDENGKLIEDDE